jgi:hypothetical protein
LQWIDYSYRIIIHLFHRGLFIEIVVFIGITIFLRRRIVIPLKNEKNSYSFRNRLHFSERKKKLLLFFISSHFYFLKKPLTYVTSLAGRPPSEYFRVAWPPTKEPRVVSHPVFNFIYFLYIWFEFFFFFFLKNKNKNKRNNVGGFSTFDLILIKIYVLSSN